LSKIGFALVNWLFHPSPKVKIATLGMFAKFGPCFAKFEEPI
jgi:hypothetical protein